MFHQGQTSSGSRTGVVSRRPVTAYQSKKYEKPLLDPYKFERVLGEGTYARVYCASLKSQASDVSRRYLAPKFAIKCIPRSNVKSKVAVDILINEIGVLKKLRHPHIVEMISFDWDKVYIYIVMEFCPCGDFSILLERNRGNVSEAQAKYYFRQLADAMCYLNSQNVVHLDLKPKNLLLTHNKQLKVADFGFSLVLHDATEDDKKFALRGTPLYMAPEIVKNATSKSKPPTQLQRSVSASAGRPSTAPVGRRKQKVSDNVFDAKSDLWSCGVILYETLLGTWPVTGSSSQEVLEKLMFLNNPISIPESSLNKLSLECADILTRLLQVRVEDRISFSDLQNHPFTDLNTYRNVVNLRTRADHSFAEAKAASNAGDLNGAIHLYAEGAKLLMDVVQVSETEFEKNALRNEVNLYTQKAEKLKLLLEKQQNAEMLKANVGTTSLVETQPEKLEKANFGEEIESLFEAGAKSEVNFLSCFRDCPEITMRHRESKKDFLLPILTKNDFVKCKDILLRVIEFYRSYLANFSSNDETSQKCRKLLSEEVLRLVSLAEKIMDLKTQRKVCLTDNSDEFVECSVNDGGATFSVNAMKTSPDESVFPEVVNDETSSEIESPSNKCLIQ